MLGFKINVSQHQPAFRAVESRGQRLETNALKTEFGDTPPKKKSFAHSRASKLVLVNNSFLFKLCGAKGEDLEKKKTGHKNEFNDSKSLRLKTK